MICFLVTAVKSTAQLIYIITILGIIIIGVQNLKSNFSQYQAYYGLNINSSNLNICYFNSLFIFDSDSLSGSFMREKRIM